MAERFVNPKFSHKEENVASERDKRTKVDRHHYEYELEDDQTGDKIMYDGKPKTKKVGLETNRGKDAYVPPVYHLGDDHVKYQAKYPRKHRIL